MKVKGTTLFYIALAGWVIATVVFGESNLVNVIGNSYIYSIVWLACRALLLVKIVSDLLRHKDATATVLIIAIIGMLSSYFSKSIFLTPLFWFLCAGREIKIEKVVKILFFTYLISVLAVVSLSIIHVIDIGQSHKAGSRAIVYSLGFGHPNTLGARAAELLLLYFCYTQLTQSETRPGGARYVWKKEAAA